MRKTWPQASIIQDGRKLAATMIQGLCGRLGVKQEAPASNKEPGGLSSDSEDLA